MKPVLIAATAALLLASGCAKSGDGGHAGHGSSAPKSEHQGMEHGGHSATGGKGLLTTDQGFTLVPTSPALTVGKQTVSFQIHDAKGTPVRSFVENQTKLLHFYLIRGDVSGYVHDHPTLASDGTWSIPVNVAAPGPYRMYTDFTAKDSAGKEHALVLSVPLTAPGRYEPIAVPAATTSQTVDGLTVSYTGAVKAGAESKLTFTVEQEGQPVRDLETYLDSFAHLTAIRAGDLAYQHVHPELTASPGQKGGPELPFSVDLPESGSWRLFLQVQRAGVLHLIPFTLSVA